MLLEKHIGNGHKIICSDDNIVVESKENLWIRIIVGESEDDKNLAMARLRFSVFLKHSSRRS